MAEKENPHAECADCEKDAFLDGCDAGVDGNLCPPIRYRNPRKNGGRKPPVKLN